MCMNSRAVHLEVAKSLETDDFILVLMRFLNRRGHVKGLRSDNRTNFVGRNAKSKRPSIELITIRFEESWCSEDVSGCSTLQGRPTCPAYGKD